MVVNLRDLSDELNQLGTQLQTSSNSLITGLNSGVGEIENIFTLFQSVNTNIFQAEAPGTGSIGQEIAGAIAMMPNIQRSFQSIGGRLPTVVRLSGQSIQEALPYVEEMQEGMREAVARLEAPDGIFDRRFESTDVDQIPDFTADSADSRAVPLDEVITIGTPLGVTHAVQQIVGGLYSINDIISTMTNQIVREDLRQLVERGFEQFDVINPEVVEDALAPLGQIQVQIQQNLEEMQSEIEAQLGSFNIDSFFNSFGNFSGFLSNIQSSITQFENILNQVSETFQNVVPNISGALIDDVIRMIDPDITDRLQQALGTNLVPASVRESILRNLVQGDLQSAAEIIQGFQTGLTDLVEITDLLESLEIDPIRILEGPLQFSSNVRQILSGATSWRGAQTILAPAGSGETSQPFAGNTSTEGESQTYSFDYVDTAEEFEADIASSTRELNTVIVHFTNTPSGVDITSETAHQAQTNAGLDGLQFHYIIRRNGRVQRGRPISAAASSGANVIDIAFVGGRGSSEDLLSLLDESTTITQQRTYRDIMKALFRVIPGADVTSAQAVAASPAPSNERSDPRITAGSAESFNPSYYHNCVHGRGNGSTGFNGFVNEPNIVPYDGSSELISGNINGLDNRFMSVMNQSLGEAGNYRAVVSSGYRPIDPETGLDSAGSSSGRHQGFAIDFGLYTPDGILLSLVVAEHLPLIQNFTRIYLRNCAGRGYTPGIGMMSSSRRYMGPTRFHFDIARTLSTGARANLSPIASNWWYGSDPGLGDRWLPAAFAEIGLGPSDRIDGPPGAVSAEVLNRLTTQPSERRT